MKNRLSIRLCQKNLLWKASDETKTRLIRDWKINQNWHVFFEYPRSTTLEIKNTSYLKGGNYHHKTLQNKCAYVNSWMKTYVFNYINMH